MYASDVAVSHLFCIVRCIILFRKIGHAEVLTSDTSMTQNSHWQKQMESFSWEYIRDNTQSFLVICQLGWLNVVSGQDCSRRNTVCVNSFAMAFRLAKHPRNGRLIAWQPLCVSPQLVGLREFQSFATSSGWTDAQMMFYCVSKQKSARLTDGEVVITIPVATAGWRYHSWNGRIDYGIADFNDLQVPFSFIENHNV